MPGRRAAKALQRLTGRTTKELILDRVMLEAARLLRFTDLTVGQVAHRVGYDDQPYFSRAFKRHSGRARRRPTGTARAEKCIDPRAESMAFGPPRATMSP